MKNKKTSKRSKVEAPQKPKKTLKEKQLDRLKERRLKAIENHQKTKNIDRFYCTPAELNAELVKWRDSSPDPEKRYISNEFGKMLIKIADKMLHRSEFRNYPKELKEDAKSFFFLKVIKGLKNYNFEFGNPFAYLSTCAWNSFLTVIAKHYKQQNIRRDVMKQLLVDLQTYQGIDPNSSLIEYIKQYIDNNDYSEPADNEK